MSGVFVFSLSTYCCYAFSRVRFERQTLYGPRGSSRNYRAIKKKKKLENIFQPRLRVKIYYEKTESVQRRNAKYLTFSITKVDVDFFSRRIRNSKC